MAIYDITIQGLSTIIIVSKCIVCITYLIIYSRSGDRRRNLWITSWWSLHGTAIIQSNGQYELQKRVLVAEGSFDNPSIFFAYGAIQKAHPVWNFQAI